MSPWRLQERQVKNIAIEAQQTWKQIASRVKVKAALTCTSNDTDEMTRIPEITTEELQDAINKLKKKANHQTATGSEPKTSKHANEFTPEAWKKVKIRVLHKKGDVEDV